MATPLPIRTIDLEARADSRLREQAPNISIWEPPGVAAAKTTVAAIPIESQLIATIEQPLHANETSRVGHDRKEREVATLLAQLTPAQSLALSKRLSVNASDDPLAVAFGRLVVERRNRLVAFLERLRRGR
jgi:hypothetical protein